MSSTEPVALGVQSPPARGDLRYEIKMIVQEVAYPWVLEHLRLDPAGVRVLYPPRRVQSIYFDCLGQEALEDNLAGISRREKIRFRWYGDDHTGVQGQLERKVRHNLLGWKDVLQIPAPIDVEGVERPTLARDVFAHLTPAWSDVRTTGLLPVQWITYRREYFTTADRTVRITMDRELRTFDQRHRMHVTRAHATPVPRVLIVEAKCHEKDHAAAKRILDRFPLVVDKCSKFVIASRPAEGPTISIAL